MKVNIRKYGASEVVLRPGGEAQTYLFNSAKDAERFHDALRTLLNG